ncbi:Nramp family divalent metal transporter [Sphingobacterium griseoflavum]|nr:Nramp family divalent metal transporter [Sphingobacterium griseoflavum]
MKNAHQHRSLDDVHESITVHQGKSKLKRLLSFFGPAYLISVGYMDPGNWATDLAGGSQFGYALLWVLLMSNLMALLLQSLCTRLGIVRGKDLAQCNREIYPKRMNFVLYILAELAIAACDLAEVLGMAIGLNLLFGIDILWGVLISFVDTFLLLYLQRLGMRKLELLIVGLITLIGICFFVEMFFARPQLDEVMQGFIPSLPNHAALYIAIGIIGATVMPHNLYLHSALVQTRKIERSTSAIRRAIKYNFLDSAIALQLAFFVNAAILILAASVFHKNGMHNVAELQDAYRLLGSTLGTDWAPKLFAVALILAGQSSTITGTLAGQIVMEGYLQLRISPFLRRLLTRLLAIVPAIVVIVLFGDKEVGQMLIFSQVLLSMQLAFAVIPLIHFVSDRAKMGEFAIGSYTRFFSWLIAAVIAVLNFQLVFSEVGRWLSQVEHVLLRVLIVGSALGLLLLLLMTFVYPWVLRRRAVRSDVHTSFEVLEFKAASSFRTILLALDFSRSDEKVISQVLQHSPSACKLVLIHVVESASVKYTGGTTEDLEAREDRRRLEQYATFLRDKNYVVTCALRYNDRINAIRICCEQYHADLLIVGSHGHTGFKDVIFGETVNKLRHAGKIPVLIAQ